MVRRKAASAVKRKAASKKKTSKGTTRKSGTKKLSPMDSGARFNAELSQEGFVKLLRFSDDDCLSHIKAKLPTGSVTLDPLLRGGIPFGRITEIYGQWHVGKTSLFDHLATQCHRMNGWVAVADTETAKSEEYSRSIGVDPDRLTYFQFERGKLTLEAVCTTILNSVRWWRENDPERPVLIGLDSLGGTPTQEEIGKELDEDKSPGAAARVMQMFKREIPQELANTMIALVIINHEYQTFGHGRSTRETYGGEALRAAASLRLKMFSLGNWIKRTDSTIIGREVGIELVKDKIHGQTRSVASVAMIHGVGIDNTWSVYEELKRRGIIVTSGSWSAINLDGEVLKFQGWHGLQRLCAKPPDEGQAPLWDRLFSVYQQVVNPPVVEGSS